MKLIDHILHTDRSPELFPPKNGGLFDYVFGAEGIYVHGKREWLEVCFQTASHKVRGLEPVSEGFLLGIPRVPESLVREVQSVSMHYGNEGLETLFHLVYSPVYPWDNGWELIEPEQTRTAASCRPLEQGEGSSHDRALIEIHSHHSMRARFSGTDDADEQGFRIYGVIGNLDRTPELRMRCGLYGYFWEIPAGLVMDLPAGLKCCVTIDEEWEEIEL